MQNLKALLREIEAAKKEGMRCVLSVSTEQFHIVDASGRIASGDRANRMEAWEAYLGNGKGK
jgi:hypothetical protein